MCSPRSRSRAVSCASSLPLSSNSTCAPFRPLDRRGIAAFYPGQITAATDYFEEVGASLPGLASKQALIFWALQDPVTRADLEQLEAAFPSHTTIELPNASHFFFEDVADQMTSEIRATLHLRGRRVRWPRLAIARELTCRGAAGITAVVVVRAADAVEEWLAGPPLMPL